MNKENIPQKKYINHKNNKLITSFFKPIINENQKLIDITNIISNSNSFINLKEEKENFKFEDKKDIMENKEIILNNNSENDFLFNIPQDEINNIYNEFSTSKNTFLNKKRKKFKNINTIKEKNEFIHYKSKKQKNKKTKISILSYNILNQIFMKKKNRPELSLENTMNKIIKAILILSPDIFCLQEADLNILKQYFHNKENNNFKNYSIYYGINCGSSFLNIIGFKNEKFNLKSFKNFSLLFMGKNSGNRGMMFLQLELIKSKKIISIYNIHFPWKYEFDRLTMLKLLFQHINNNNNNKSKIFIAGDFNAEPNSNTIKLFYFNKFLNEKKYYENYDINDDNISFELMKLSENIYNKFHMKSAYQYYNKKEKNIIGDYYFHPICTSRTHFYKRNIDYIFFSKKIYINKILKLPSELDIDKENYLPSKDFPSDHLKLYGEFTI